MGRYAEGKASVAAVQQRKLCWDVGGLSAEVLHEKPWYIFRNESIIAPYLSKGTTAFFLLS